ncbi:MAG: hypothetical protein K5866_05145 [Treponema sp.]|nr:hypothetical protein [Treponema sp.]
MKKLLMIFAILTAFSTACLFAQENEGNKKNESKWSTLSYVNVPVYKVLEGKDAYVVIYQKNKTGIGNVVIPKKWAHGNPEDPRKLKFRAVNTANSAYLTVVKKEGEFKRVVLSVPMSKSNGIWGLADYHKDIEGSDKDTLEELEL